MSGFLGNLLFGKDYGGKQSKDLGKWSSQVATQYGSANAALLKQLGAIQKGYGNAHKALQLQGSLGTKAIMDQSKQSYAGNAQDATSRGLYGTTALDAANRGTGYATNDALAGLNAQLGQLGADLEMGQGQAEAGVYGNLAGVNQNYASVLAQLGLGELGGKQYGKQGGLLPALVQAAAIYAGSKSDRRLKRNIESVGMANGINIYEFEYLERDDLPEGRWRGVMADEVEGIPGAVSRGDDGFLMVDYSKLGFEMARVS